MINISQPLFIYDLETTGTDPKTAKIVSMSFQFFPLGMSSPTYTKLTFLVDPDMSIPADSSKVHGITDDMVIYRGIFRYHTDKFMDFLMYENLIVCGYNVRSFDNVVLQRELNEAGIEFDFKDIPCLDLLAMWREAEPRTLTGAVKRFLGIDLENAHDAETDTTAVRKLIKPFLTHFDGFLPEDPSQWNTTLFPKELRSLDSQGKIMLNDDNRPSFSFGKWAGKDLAVVDKSYLTWFVKQEFSEDAKEIVRKFII